MVGKEFHGHANDIKIVQKRDLHLRMAICWMITMLHGNVIYLSVRVEQLCLLRIDKIIGWPPVFCIIETYAFAQRDFFNSIDPKRTCGAGMKSAIGGHHVRIG